MPESLDGSRSIREVHGVWDFFVFIAEWMMRFMHSFDTDAGGLSARKLSAFAGVMVSLYITYQHTNSDNLWNILVTWMAFIFLCLSVVTIEQIIRFKNGGGGGTNPPAPTK